MYDFKIRKKKLEKRVGQLFSQFLLYEVQDPRIHEHFVSVSKVEYNQELTKVTIFFQCLNKEQRNKVIKLLYNLTPFFLNFLKQKMSIRRIPKVVYINDLKYQESSDVLKMIEELGATAKQSDEDVDKDTSESKKSVIQ